MENPKDLKKRLEDKVENLEFGETEVLFWGNIHF